MHMKNTVGILLTTVLLAGCPSGEDGIVITIPGGGTGGGTVTVAGNPSFSQYEGNYFLNCTQDPEGSAVWLTGEFSFQSDTLVSIATGYIDSECAQPVVTAESTASIVYPGGTVSTSLGEADFINFTNQTTFIDGEPQPIDNTNSFDIILLDGNNLFLGLNTEELNGESPETRPNTLEIGVPFTRL